MPKIIIILFCQLLFAISVAAQQPKLQPGSASELKGVTRIHVAADTESARKNIVESIRRSLPQLTVTDKADEAEVWLVFRTNRRAFPRTNSESGLATTRSMDATSAEYELVVSGQVIKPISKESALLVIEFKDATTLVFDDSFSKRFARTFIKSYKRAN